LIRDPDNKKRSLRPSFIEHLENHGVGYKIFYPEPLNKIPFIAEKVDQFAEETPVADMVSNSIVSLPIWPELRFEEVEYVVSIINKFKG